MALFGEFLLGLYLGTSGDTWYTFFFFVAWFGEFLLGLYLGTSGDTWYTLFLLGLYLGSSFWGFIWGLPGILGILCSFCGFIWGVPFGALFGDLRGYLVYFVEIDHFTWTTSISFLLLPSQGVEWEGSIVLRFAWERLAAELVCPFCCFGKAFPTLVAEPWLNLPFNGGLRRVFRDWWLFFLVAMEPAGSHGENIPVPKTPGDGRSSSDLKTTPDSWEIPTAAELNAESVAAQTGYRQDGSYGWKKKWWRQSWETRR